MLLVQKTQLHDKNYLIGTTKEENAVIHRGIVEFRINDAPVYFHIDAGTSKRNGSTYQVLIYFPSTGIDYNQKRVHHFTRSSDGPEAFDPNLSVEGIKKIIEEHYLPYIKTFTDGEVRYCILDKPGQYHFLIEKFQNGAFVAI